MITVPKSAKQFCEMAKGLADAIDAISAINGLEQVEAEAKTRLAQLAADEARARDDITRADMRVATAQASALEITEQAKVDAETIRAKAADEANQIRAAADSAVEAAKVKERRAETDQRKAEAACASCVARLAELEPKVAEAQATIAKAEAIKKAMG